MSSVPSREFPNSAVSGAPIVEIKPGLERMRRLLESKDVSSDQIRFLHLAGTNGKGSLGCFCACILVEAGWKVGWFSSPHLHDRTESIRVMGPGTNADDLMQNLDRWNIPDSELALRIQHLADDARTTAEGLQDPPSAFELLTAAALEYFRDRQCDWVIWETGMGGLDDATNIIDAPAACLITAIGLDHVQWLGETFVDIARHKAGIIKTGCPVYLYDPTDAIEDPMEADKVYHVVAEVCQKNGSELNLISSQSLQIISRGWDGQRFTLVDNLEAVPFHTKQLGVFQPQLASMAIRLFRDMGVADEHIRQGIAAAAWPARMELCRNPSMNGAPIFLDGAHNPQSCRALEQTLAYLVPDQRIVFLTGILADKDIRSMLEPVFQSTAYHTDVIICTRPDSERAMSGKVLAEHTAALLGRTPVRLQFNPNKMYNDSGLVFYSEDPAEAARFALEIRDQEHRPLCAFGSFYLAGAIRSILIQS